jgi:GMP synthase-like glutamine amidotransferase
VAPATCLIVQHVEPEGPYAIADALEEAGVAVDVRRVFAGEVLPPDVSDVDGLVIMGGPMSASSDEGFPTRGAELDLLADALRLRRPTLGVCLGAQLLAVAAGGAVYPGAAGLEIGWAPVELTAGAGQDPLLAGLPRRLTVLHWHGDTFDPPAGATLLVANDRYRSQAFRSGDRAWGLQFHLEVDGRAVASFLDAFGADTEQAGTTAAAIAGATAAALVSLEPHRTRVLARFAELVVAHDRERLVDRA